MAALAKRLRMAHRGGQFGICRLCHQAVADHHEMFGNDRKPRFGQQKMNIGNAPMKRILDWDNRARGGSVLHCVDCILERETGQRQAIGIELKRREM